MMSLLFRELKRRNVLRVGAAYLVTAWLVIQVVETIFPAFGIGEAAVRYVTIAFAIGLIPVLVLSWVFEWTPEGLRRDAEVDVPASTSLRAAKRLDRAILVVLALASGYFAFDKFLLEPQRDIEEAAQQQVEIEEARKAGRSEALVESFGEKSIAVLPFRDMSPDGDQAYFSDGIAEELLNLLAKIPELRVISRTSSFAFKDQSLEVPEIARRLKVGHVLEGSVRKDGNTVRITAQLIDARSDTHLWSQTWDRDLTSILAIQDEIAATVASSLQSVLLGPPDSATAPQMSDNELEAYELVLKGRYLFYQYNADAYQRAMPLFERAIELAPNWAPAHAGLAKVLRQLTASLTLDPELYGPRLEAELDMALALDPEDPDALTTRGAVLGLRQSEPDIEAAREHWRRALSVNPNDGDALRWLGFSYINVDSNRYLEYMERAYGVAPTNSLVSMWLVYALARFDRFDEAMEILRDWHTLDPENSLPFGVAGDLYYQTRQLDLALKSYYRVFRMAPDSVDDEIQGLGWLMVDGLSLRDPELILKWAERRIANAPYSGDAQLLRTIAMRRLGRREEAIRDMDELFEQHPDWWGFQATFDLVVTQDYRRSRELFEIGGISERDFDQWPTKAVLDYACVLQKTDDPGPARLITDATLARLEEQMAAGVKKEGWFELIFFAAELHALRGENLQALDYLRQDAANNGLSAVAALKIWPQFDGLRENPDFQALLAEQDEINAQWWQRLEDEDLLLTPEEALALEDFDFDPFAEANFGKQ